MRLSSSSKSRLRIVLRTHDIAKTGGETERLQVLAGVFEDSSQILMSDGEVAIDLRDQRGVELLVPSDDGDAEQQRQDHQHRQQGDREKAEADRASLNWCQGVVGPLKHSTRRICDRSSCAKCRAFGPPRPCCRRSPSARPGYGAAPSRRGCRCRALSMASPAEIVGKRSEDQRALDDVAQLAHVARPVIPGKRRPARNR